MMKDWKIVGSIMLLLGVTFACIPSPGSTPREGFALLGDIANTIDTANDGFFAFQPPETDSGDGTSGNPGTDDDPSDDIGGPLTDVDDLFRPVMRIILTNDANVELVETKLAAWISDSSLPTQTDERDEAVSQLSGDGWVLQQESVSIGRVSIAGPVWLRTGQGIGGSIPVKIAREGSDPGALRDSITAVGEVTFRFITPDGALMFSDLPDSCDSISFLYTETGVAIPGTSDAQGGQKAVRHVQHYQCDPFMPGFFLKPSGAELPNEYDILEDVASTISISFTASASASGDFATVTIAKDST
jgi:hypothetical protein